jgi:HEAT repeat protein
LTGLRAIGQNLFIVRTPRQLIIVALASAAVILVAVLFLLGGEPCYHGQPLSYWTVKLKHGDLNEQVEARDALKAMEKSAVPILMHILEKEDPPIKLKILEDYGARFPILRRWLVPISYQTRMDAASALGEIGPSASNAVPILLQAGKTNFPAINGPCIAALMKIRSQPLDPVILALDNPYSAQWELAAYTAEEFGTNARAAVPALCRALRSTNFTTVVVASYALVFIHSDPATAVPALIETVKRDDLAGSYFLINSIGALGNYASEARSAEPTLRLLLNDPNPLVRGVVLQSLCKIVPPDDFKTLVPVLIQSAKDPDKNVSSTAEYLLQKYDPKAAIAAGLPVGIRLGR